MHSFQDRAPAAHISNWLIDGLVWLFLSSWSGYLSPLLCREHLLGKAAAPKSQALLSGEPSQDTHPGGQVLGETLRMLLLTTALEVHSLISLSYRWEKLMLRKVKQFAQSHTSRKYRGQDLNLGP